MTPLLFCCFFFFCIATAALAIAATAAESAFTWKFAPIPVTEITSEPLRTASSEGIFWHPQRSAFVFNGDSSFAVAKLLLDGDNNSSSHFETLASKRNVVPPKDMPPHLGRYRHCGDSGWSDFVGSGIAPISGYPNRTVPPAFVAINADTLDADPALLQCVMPPSAFPRGEPPQRLTPWVAAARGKQIFSSDYDVVDRIYVYNLSDSGGASPKFTCRFSHSIRLNMLILGAQGGVVLPGGDDDDDDVLLLSADDECIYEITLSTGHVETAFCFWSLREKASKEKSLHFKLFEMEGLAIANLTSQGLGYLHVLTGDLALKPGMPRPVYHLVKV